jgi:anti-anti-sigma regulatory factor
VPPSNPPKQRIAFDPTLLAGIPVEAEGKEDTTVVPLRRNQPRLERVSEESGIAIYALRDHRFLELPLPTELLDQLCESRRTVLDFRGREQTVTSSGLQNLLNLQSKARTTGTQLVLCNVPSSIRSLLALLNLDRPFDIQPGLPEAVAALKNTEPLP